MTLRRKSAKCLLMVCIKAGKPAAMQYLFLPKPSCPLIHDQSDQCGLQKVIICRSGSCALTLEAELPKWRGSHRQIELQMCLREPSSTHWVLSYIIKICMKGQQPSCFFFFYVFLSLLGICVLQLILTCLFLLHTEKKKTRNSLKNAEWHM